MGAKVLSLAPGDYIDLSGPSRVIYRHKSGTREATLVVEAPATTIIKCVRAFVRGGAGGSDGPQNALAT